MLQTLNMRLVWYVLQVTKEMLQNSVTLRIANVTDEAFLDPYLVNFIDGVAAVLNVPTETGIFTT